MTPDQRRIINALRRLNLSSLESPGLSGGWDERFVRSLAAYSDCTVLSPRQSHRLECVARKYAAALSLKSETRPVYQDIIDAALAFIKGFTSEVNVPAATDVISAALAASPTTPHLTTAFEAIVSHADQVFPDPLTRPGYVFLLNCAVTFLQSEPRA